MTTKNATQAIVELTKQNPEFRHALVEEIVKDANVRDFTFDPWSQRNMLRELRGGDLIQMTFSPQPEHPERAATRLVTSEFDSVIPGVYLKGIEKDPEFLVDRGEGQPLVWVPGEGESAIPIIKLRRIRSQLKLGTEEAQINKTAETILEHMGGRQKLASMLGARNLEITDEGISFEWPNRKVANGNKVTIRRGPAESYDMFFFNKTAEEEMPIKECRRLYPEDLARIFEQQTGWFLRL